MSEMPRWEARFRAPKITFPRWSRRAPDRTVYESTGSGVWQVHCWSPSTGERRQVSNHPVGVVTGFPSFDGAEVVFWQEDTGDETGRWLGQAFEGGGDEPFVPSAPLGWSDGIAQAEGVVAVGISDRDGFGIHVSVDGAPAKEIVHSSEWLAIAGAEQGRDDLAGLSADGTLLALAHAEDGSLIHPAIRVVDPRTGEIRGERRDEGKALVATAWSPVETDHRLAVTHERGDRERPALWNLDDDSWQDLNVSLPGDVLVADWWPDASALLLGHLFEGRHELYRYELATGALTKVETPAGTTEVARVRPDGTVWFLHTDATRTERVLDDRGNEILRAVGEPEAPEGRAFADWRYENGNGEQVHGWLVTPPGDGPWPLFVYVHGGPHWLYEDRYMPAVQAYVDLGFAVATPNYRGSTGYGRAWRDALTGDVGFADVDDVVAGYRDLVARGIADPERAVIGGWSWGGYITLMALGRYPDLWRCGLAGVPVGDYVRAYEEEAPALQAMDRALLGGSPDEVPDAYHRGSPLTYADDVVAPVLFVIGDNDSRCPLGQALAYVDRLAETGTPHEVYRFTTGHGSHEVDEDVRQQRLIMDFLVRHVPGLNEPGLNEPGLNEL
jgi:dipeptidyl aminopeptidase/acylaminoacyl peptidase